MSVASGLNSPPAETIEEPAMAMAHATLGRRVDGVAMRVLALAPDHSLARCAGVDGIPATIETVLVGPLEPGAVVLVHGGVALLRLDAEWAS